MVGAPPLFKDSLLCCAYLMRGFKKGSDWASIFSPTGTAGPRLKGPLQRVACGPSMPKSSQPAFFVISLAGGAPAVATALGNTGVSCSRPHAEVMLRAGLGQQVGVLFVVGHIRKQLRPRRNITTARKHHYVRKAVHFALI